MEFWKIPRMYWNVVGFFFRRDQSNVTPKVLVLGMSSQRGQWPRGIAMIKAPLPITGLACGGLWEVEALSPQVLMARLEV